MTMARIGVAFVLASILVVGGCAGERVQSTLTLARSLKIRLPTPPLRSDAIACRRACEPGRELGECLSRCRGRIIEPGTCSANDTSADEICGDKRITWTEVREGRCSPPQPVDDGVRIVACIEARDTTDHAATVRKVLGTAVVLVLAAPLLLLYAQCSRPNTCIH